MSITTLLDLAADVFGDRVAMGPRAAAPGATRFTYAELRTAAQTAAARLTAGDETTPTLAYLAGNGAAAPVALFAAAYAGTTYAPLNHRLPADALGALIERVLPACAVVHADDTAVALAAKAHPVENAEAWLGACREGSATAFEGAATDEPPVPAVLLFTSGTSAAPKAIRLRHDNLLAYILGTVDFASAGEDEALLLAVPPFHIAGVSAVLSSLYAGRRIVPLPAFSAKAWLAAVRDEGITHAFVVPTMLARIVEAVRADPGLAVPGLRHLAYGGARMPLPVLEQALELFPETGFVNAYGLTETSSTIAVLGPDDHRSARAGDAEARERLSSVGRPVPGVELRIVGETGQDVAVGERGELRLRGAQIAGGTGGAALDPEGWFVTGDQASLDAAGYLYVHGRGDDTIIRGGENIGPSEIEDALLRHPDVAAACVVGLPDTEWGERIAAAVVASDGSDPDTGEIAEWLRGRIGSLKTPQDIRVVAALPMTPTGKVVRRQVRADLAGA
ncbi:fatty acid--CoA ligase family protein [Streptomycetaceae bacterium NBC_01309]